MAGASAPGFQNGPAASALFRDPERLFPVADGVLLMDVGNHAVRLLPTDGGAVTTVAGDGKCTLGNELSLCEPVAAAKGPQGELYVLSRATNSVHRIANGVMTRIIGEGDPGVLVRPSGMALAGNHLIIAAGRQCALKFYNLDGSRVSPVVDVGTCQAMIDGQPLSYVADVAVSPDGRTAWFTDFDSKLFRVPLTAGLPSGPARFVTGQGAGFRDGSAANALFFWPAQVAPDANGVFVADRRNHRLRYVRNDGTVSTILGNGEPGLDDGAVASARIAEPMGVAVVGSELWFTSPYDHRVRRVREQVVESVAGPTLPLQDGCASTVALAAPMGIAADPQTGDIYFSDSLHHAIRVLTASGFVATLAGGSPGALDGRGAQAKFLGPRALKRRPDGKLVIADTGNAQLRLLDPATGEVTTLVGKPGGRSRIVGGCSPRVVLQPSEMELCEPKGLAVTDAGEAYFTDCQEPGQGVLARLSADGARVTQLKYDWFFPRGIDVSSSGRVTVADAAAEEVHEYDAQGNRLATFFGDLECGERGNHWEWYCEPSDSAYLGADVVALYSGSSALRLRRAQGGAMSTLAGTAFSVGLADGRSDTRFDRPMALAVLPDGSILIADTGNNRLRRLSP